VEHSLGILVWTTLITGSAIVLVLALPDVFLGLLGLLNRLRVRDALKHATVAPIIADRSHPRARRGRR
jgi:hypothetical protein